jgi:hypothetical protein
MAKLETKQAVFGRGAGLAGVGADPDADLVPGEESKGKKNKGKEKRKASEMVEEDAGFYDGTVDMAPDPDI